MTWRSNPTCAATISGARPFRRRGGATRLRAQQDVLLVQRRRNRAAFLRDEEVYCRRYGLNDAQRDAVRRRDVLAMIAAGGNIYYLAKLAGIFGLNVQDVGAQQTGASVDEFRARLRAAGG